MTTALALVEPQAAGTERVAVLARALGARGYTAAELQLIAEELPFDPRASHNFGRGFNLADAERIVQEHRADRLLLSRKLTYQEASDLLGRRPELDPERFGCVDFDARNNRLYRYRMASNAVAAPDAEVEL